MRPRIMPCPNAVASDPSQKPNTHRFFSSARARIRNSNDTLRSMMPNAINANGPYSLPNTLPHANGNAAANKPMPSNGQNSLASRQGLNKPIMRPRSSGGANGSKIPTPMSKPSSTTPPTINKNNSPTNTNGIQNVGSFALTPRDAARSTIIATALRVYGPAPRRNGPHETTCR